MSRTQQIIAAMKGRKASAVNDTRLRDTARLKLSELSESTGQPQTSTTLTGLALAAVRAAARTVIHEDEVLVALEMGAFGEFPGVPSKMTQANVAEWMGAYAVCAERAEAVRMLNTDAARDRARADAVERDARRRDFEEHGAAKEWERFKREGWNIWLPSYAAAVYDRIGPDAMRPHLSREDIDAARAEACSAVRRDSERLRTAKDSEIEGSPFHRLHFKAALLRRFFGNLQARGLELPPASVSPSIRAVL